MSYRGSQVAPFAKPEDVSSLIAASAGIIRFQMVVEPELRDTEAWKKRIGEHLQYLDGAILPLLNGTKLILDMHTPPNGSLLANLDTLRDMWATIATRYKDDPRVSILGLINEPLATSQAVAEVQDTLYKTIRAIDKDKPISITTRACSPTLFKDLKFNPDPQLLYECHMYYPLSFTHQGVGTNPVGHKYPTARLNKDKLVRYLAPARNFQKEHHARILVGEFGASSFTAPDYRYNYLKDCIDLFEAYNWRWVYHAWQEAICWRPSGKVLDLLLASWAKV